MRPNRHILIVGDNPAHQEPAIRVLLENAAQVRIEIAQGIAQALAWLFGEGVHLGRDVRRMPAAVLLDVSPPEYPGLEVLAQMRSHPVTHAVPVVVLAPADDAAVVARSYEMGANSVLLKTADATRLAEMLRRMQAYWLQINETV